jgi:hypothetical protein
VCGMLMALREQPGVDVKQRPASLQLSVSQLVAKVGKLVTTLTTMATSRTMGVMLSTMRVLIVRTER